MTRSFFFLIILLLPAIFAFHPFYMTVVEAEYKSSTKELGVSCKVFPDDLEDALPKINGKKLDLKNGDKREINNVLSDYFGKHLKANINGKRLPLHYLGYENDNEASYIFFNLTGINQVNKLGIYCDVMYEYKEEQSNIIHIVFNGKRQSFKASAPMKEVFYK